MMQSPARLLSMFGRRAYSQVRQVTILKPSLCSNLQ